MTGAINVRLSALAWDGLRPVRRVRVRLPGYDAMNAVSALLDHCAEIGHEGSMSQDLAIASIVTGKSVGFLGRLPVEDFYEVFCASIEAIACSIVHPNPGTLASSLTGMLGGMAQQAQAVVDRSMNLSGMTVHVAPRLNFPNARTAADAEAISQQVVARIEREFAMRMRGIMADVSFAD